MLPISNSIYLKLSQTSSVTGTPLSTFFRGGKTTCVTNSKPASSSTGSLKVLKTVSTLKKKKQRKVKKMLRNINVYGK